MSRTDCTGLRGVVADGVYRRGLKSTAALMRVSAGNLSCALRGTKPLRRLGIEDLERYIEVTGDKSPIAYLVGKYMGDEASARDQALSQVAELLTNLPAMMAAAGLPTTTKRSR